MWYSATIVQNRSVYALAAAQPAQLLHAVHLWSGISLAAAVAQSHVQHWCLSPVSIAGVSQLCISGVRYISGVTALMQSRLIAVMRTSGQR